MRVSCLLVAVVAIAFPLRYASAQGKDKKAMNLQAEVMTRVMARFDLNGDGNVDDEEKAKVVEDFTKDIDGGKIPEGFGALLDKNKNGKLDPAEAAAFQAVVGQLRAAAAGGPPQFGAGNGGPAAPGFAPGFGGPGFAGGDAFSGQVPPEVLKKFDKNKDGELDDKERKAAMAAFGPKKSRKEKMQAKLDLNGDGKITKEEREEVAAQRKAEAAEKKAAAAEKKAKAKAKRGDDKDSDDKPLETKDADDAADEEGAPGSAEGKRTPEFLMKAVDRGYKSAMADELDEADKKRLNAQVARLKKEIEKGNDPRLEVDDLSRLPGDDVRLIRAYFPDFMPE